MNSSFPFFFFCVKPESVIKKWMWLVWRITWSFQVIISDRVQSMPNQWKKLTLVSEKNFSTYSSTQQCSLSTKGNYTRPQIKSWKSCFTYKSCFKQRLWIKSQQKGKQFAWFTSNKSLGTRRKIFFKLQFCCSLPRLMPGIIWWLLFPCRVSSKLTAKTTC